MYKDILVHIPSTQSSKPVIDAAISLAKRARGRLDAASFGYEPITGEVAFEGAAAIAAVLEVQRQRALEQAKGALAVFEAEARLAEITYNCRSVAATPAEAAEAMGEMSRLYDLTVVSQPEPGKSLFDEMIPEAVLFNSGGPVLVVPYIHKGPLNAGNVMVCWDGKREAARALRDAMPLITAARAVRIVSVNEDPADFGRATSKALAAHLERKGVAVKVQQLVEERSDIFNPILSAAADCDADLLVMGGYGHSRLREFVLGGVTRGILTTMTVPVLMSH